MFKELCAGMTWDEVNLLLQHDLLYDCGYPMLRLHVELHRHPPPIPFA